MMNIFLHTKMIALEDTKHFVFDSRVNQILKIKSLFLTVVGRVKYAEKTNAGSELNSSLRFLLLLLLFVHHSLKLLTSFVYSSTRQAVWGKESQKANKKRH